MRALIVLCLIGSTWALMGQDLVSSAILSYHAGAYDRCIDDLNKSFKNGGISDNAIRAKAYYYRGMARVKLLAVNPNSSLVGNSPSMTILDDLTKAKNLDKQWTDRANVEILRIIGQVMEGIRSDLERARQTFDPNVSRPLLSAAADKLDACMEAYRSASLLELKAQVAQTHGDVYYNMAEVGDPLEVQRQFLSHYSQAIEYYEEWLKTQEGTREVFSALRDLSAKMEDRDRETRYAYLVEQTGG